MKSKRRSYRKRRFYRKRRLSKRRISRKKTRRKYRKKSYRRGRKVGGAKLAAAGQERVVTDQLPSTIYQLYVMLFFFSVINDTNILPGEAVVQKFIGLLKSKTKEELLFNDDISKRLNEMVAFLGPEIEQYFNAHLVRHKINTVLVRQADRKEINRLLDQLELDIKSQITLDLYSRLSRANAYSHWLKGRTTVGYFQHEIGQLFKIIKIFNIIEIELQFFGKLVLYRGLNDMKDDIIRDDRYNSLSFGISFLAGFLCDSNACPAHRLITAMKEGKEEGILVICVLDPTNIDLELFYIPKLNLLSLRFESLPNQVISLIKKTF